MVSAASLSFVDDTSYHCSNPARKSCTLATALELALHLKASELPLATEEMMVNYKLSGFLRSTLPGCKNVTMNVGDRERSESVTVAAKKREEAEAERPLRLEQKSNSVQREPVPQFSQPRDPVVRRFAVRFLMAVTRFTVPSHRVFFWCGADHKCFHLAKTTVLRQIAKVGLVAGTDVELSEKETEAVGRVAFLVPKVGLRTCCGLCRMRCCCTNARLRVCSFF